jgi:rhodanese-related sulfurtransferase
MRHAEAEAGSEPHLSSIAFDELFRRIEDEDTTYVLLNVLPRSAFEAGRIPGSLNLPLAEIAERAHEVLPGRDQETIVYCVSSACSLAEQAAVLLRSLGYSRVREFSGGMEEWTERGGRIERAAPAVRATPPSRPVGRLARLRERLAPISPVAAFVWASGRPLRVLFGIWLAISALFALLYWSAGHGAAALVSGSTPVARDLPGLGTAFGFSFAEALSASYGDVVAVGWTRFAALLETALCLVLFSALVSRILGARQEELLSEVHRLTFENRLGRVRTNLHLVLAELGEISGDCADPAVPPRRLRARTESVAMIFAGELQAVRDLVHGRPGGADNAALEALFACLAAGLQELADLLTCLPARQVRSGTLRRSLRRIAQLGADLCGACSARPLTLAIRNGMDRVHRLCQSLCDEPRPGDPAPPFALPGSDGQIHRLTDYLGRQPVVLAWFPRAFTGG